MTYHVPAVKKELVANATPIVPKNLLFKWSRVIPRYGIDSLSLSLSLRRRFRESDATASLDSQMLVQQHLRGKYLIANQALLRTVFEVSH